MIPFAEAVGYVWLVWGGIVTVVQSIGIWRIFTNYSSIPNKPTSPDLPPDEIPHVTLIRPAKGLEPFLAECLACSFYQRYPRDKLSLYFCVSSKDDAAYPVIKKLLEEFPDRDARLFVESDDPLLQDENGIKNMGPNPKIRNLSRAYREAKEGAIWVMDCNVWLVPDTVGRMVDKLYGYLPGGKRAKPCKLVHQLPVVVDLASLSEPTAPEAQALLAGSSASSQSLPPAQPQSKSPFWLSQGGGRLEEMFIATSHAKFYSSFNTMSIAPCIVGKSNMFRKSHLEQVTDPAQNPIIPPSAASRPKGLDWFSPIICEDHVIGDLLWRTDIPGFDNHGFVRDLAIQPMSGMSVSSYIARRVRWLRVRKYTVLAATFVEPGIEPFLCCLYLSFSLTTLPLFHNTLGIPHTWSAFWLCWITGITAWMCVDWVVFHKLHSGQSISVDDNTPSFAHGMSRRSQSRRGIAEWVFAWFGREILAFPIWTWAVLLGTTVNWRGKKFRVRSDMTVVSIDEDQPSAISKPSNGHTPRKVD